MEQEPGTSTPLGVRVSREAELLHGRSGVGLQSKNRIKNILKYYAGSSFFLITFPKWYPEVILS